MEETEAALFVDANNAFNSLNRQVTLLNSRSICPPLAPILINTYRNPSFLFVDGEHILSEEGTTQGDPLAMAMYTIGTLPLIEKLQDLGNQVWFADDSAAGSTIEQLREWWDRLREEGPKYGYHTNCSKTKLLVKEGHFQHAQTIFKDTGITIVSDGATYLGGAIGSRSFVKDSIQQTVSDWISELTTLVKIAKTHPHTAYSSLTHGIQSRCMELSCLYH
jgi:hypothetical protein